jgi:thioesterase domain-containing protein
VPIDQAAINRLIRITGKSWHPGPVDAPGVLFRAKFSGDEALPGYDFTNGWRNLFVRGLKVIESTGDHVSMVSDENAATLVQQINEALERCDTSAVAAAILRAA